MSDGNKFDVTTYVQQRQQSRLPWEEMGNVLLDAMQGTLICLDSHHIIVDVSKTIKRYFGFEQSEVLGLSILILVEDSERDLFSKFLASSSQLFDICCVRMMMGITNEYRLVKVHRKKKLNPDTVDVHSTTPRHSGSVGTILVLTLDDSSYIDITLSDVHKHEFYTKMNLIGEIIFEDHRGALLTGYLPHEIVSQSIFNFVYHEDRLVKLHALWKCVTTGGSKLQWRLNARDGSLVYLQTECKLVANHQNQDTIVAHNELLSPVQRAQFDELQTAWRHQCAADIKGNSSSFRLITSTDAELLPIPSGECRICVPSLNMCFSTNKLQCLNIVGNIFEASKTARPLTIQDYISILFQNDKYLDSDLMAMIHSLPSLSSQHRQLSHGSANNQTTGDMDTSDGTMEDRYQSIATDSSLHKKSESDSIVRGILSNSMKYNHEKPSDDSSPTLTRLLNGNTAASNETTRTSASQQSQIHPSKSNQVPLNPEAIQQQHVDFIKKYKAAKAKLESQLELARTPEVTSNGQANDIMKRNTILNKLSQLEHIKNKHLARTIELNRQTQHTTAAPSANNVDQQDVLNSFFVASPPISVGMMAGDNNGSLPPLYNSSTLTSPAFYQRNSPPIYRPTFDSGQPSTPYQEPHSRVKTPVFEEFLTPSTYAPVNSPSLSVHSYMNVSFQGTTNNSSSIPPPSFNHHHHHHHHHHNTSYPY